MEIEMNIQHTIDYRFTQNQHLLTLCHVFVLSQEEVQVYIMIASRKLHFCLDNNILENNN